MKILSYIEQSIHPEFFMMLFVGTFCGLLIGLERQIKGRPAGLRTSALVCLGTAAFVFMGRHVDTSPMGQLRIIAAVISGIGFLGAGLMINRQGHIKGVTSAAVIWSQAAIGCFVGIGFYVEAVLLALIILAILIVIKKIESKSERLKAGPYAYFSTDPNIEIPKEKKDQEGKF